MARDEQLDSMRYGDGTAEVAVVMLHGFGADYGDLVPLAHAIDPDGVWDWHFLRAPLQLQYAGTVYGRAWFPDREDEMLQALQGDYFRDLEALDPSGLVRSGAQVQQYVQRHELNGKTLFVGGFSQGAMVALESVLQDGAAPAGLFLLSGALIAAVRTAEAARSLPGCPFFQSHGTGDVILSFAAGERLHQALVGAGWEGQLHPFGGGHAVPEQVVVELHGWLAGQCNRLNLDQRSPG